MKVMKQYYDQSLADPKVRVRTQPVGKNIKIVTSAYGHVIQALLSVQTALYKTHLFNSLVIHLPIYADESENANKQMKT